MLLHLILHAFAWIARHNQKIVVGLILSRLLNGRAGLSNAPRFVAFALKHPCFPPFDSHQQVDALLLSPTSGIVNLCFYDSPRQLLTVALNRQRDVRSQEMQEKPLELAWLQIREAKAKVFIQVLPLFHHLSCNIDASALNCKHKCCLNRKFRDRQ